MMQQQFLFCLSSKDVVREKIKHYSDIICLEEFWQTITSAVKYILMFNIYQHV